jgi:hypothetical protein
MDSNYGAVEGSYLYACGVGRPQCLFGGFGYYQLVIIFCNIVPLIMELTISDSESEAGSRRGSFQKVGAETISESLVTACQSNKGSLIRTNRTALSYRDVDSTAALFGGDEPISLESSAVIHRFKHLRVLHATPPRRTLKSQRKSLDDRRLAAAEALKPEVRHVGRESDSGQSDSAEEKLSTRSEFIRCRWTARPGR